MGPMAKSGEEGIGSMGNDSPLAVLSQRSKPLFNYFRQLFAQVTNPPIDPIREAVVMSLVSFVGPRPNILDINNVNPAMRLEVEQPILDFDDMARVRNIGDVNVEAALAQLAQAPAAPSLEDMRTAVIASAATSRAARPR